MNKQLFDLIIIGGGINGVGIAADAAGRGLSVLLCEQGDLASGTSWVSSKLIHGGLRYLEQYQLGLVRKALQERELFLQRAPHLVHPLQFILPHQLRPHWLIRAGLYVYDHLGGRTSLPKSQAINLTCTDYGIPLKTLFKRGFSYYDCRVDDSRLVIANAQLATQHGATILNYHRCTQLHRHADYWEVTLADPNQQRSHYQGKVLINACGPWVSQLAQQAHIDVPVCLVQGSHIVVPKLYAGSHAYILQHTDTRIIFVIPFAGQYSLIGTTDNAYQGDPAKTQITSTEIDYLCQIVNHYFKQSIQPQHIVWHYSGIRTLPQTTHDNLSAITREYQLQIEATQAPLLSIIGGKITTYRKLAEDILTTLQPHLSPFGTSWTAKQPLPGGDMANLDQFIQQVQHDYPWLPLPTLHRYCTSYGTAVYQLLDNVTNQHELGTCIGADLYTREVDYLVQSEWAHTVEDIVWRRSKLGLILDGAQLDQLERYLKDLY